MQFSFPAAKILQKLHICKHSDIFLQNKIELMDFLAYIDFFS